MKIKYDCKKIPLGFSGLAFINTIYFRGAKERVTTEQLNHEMIHIAQQKKLLVIFFFLLYFGMWGLNLLWCPLSAYKNIPFELEAKANEDRMLYKPTAFSWTNYLFRSYKHL